MFCRIICCPFLGGDPPPINSCGLGNTAVNQCTKSVLTPTCTNRFPSGSSAILPPASAPLLLFLYPGGVCRRGKCKTSRAPARTERPTQTACPGSVVPTSFPIVCLARFRTSAACTSKPVLKKVTSGSVQSWSLSVRCEYPSHPTDGVEYEWSFKVACYPVVWLRHRSVRESGFVLVRV